MTHDENELERRISAYVDQLIVDDDTARTDDVGVVDASDVEFELLCRLAWSFSGFCVRPAHRFRAELLTRLLT
jgi:hypothetical protein